MAYNKDHMNHIVTSRMSRYSYNTFMSLQTCNLDIFLLPNLQKCHPKQYYMFKSLNWPELPWSCSHQLSKNFSSYFLDKEIFHNGLPWSLAYSNYHKEKYFRGQHLTVFNNCIPSIVNKACVFLLFPTPLYLLSNGLSINKNWHITTQFAQN